MRKLLFFLLLLFVACAPQGALQPSAQVNLNDLQPLPQPTQSVPPLRVAIAAVISPKGTIESYAALLDYLSLKTGRPVELVQRRTYAEVNDLVARGAVDLAFVCTSAYILGQESFGMRLLVVPQVDGESVYYSYLIVPSDSPAQNMSDLRGKTFAFTDPMSLSGRVYPTWLVGQLGSTPEQFFARTFFTYSHDEAIYAVANHLADGAAVDSLVYEFTAKRDPTLKARTRVIHISPPFGIPPVVVGPSIRPQTETTLRQILLSMDSDAAGQAALAVIGVERFIIPDPNLYESARALMHGVILPGLLP